ncbi:AMP deaminase [Xanthoria parietina]
MAPPAADEDQPPSRIHSRPVTSSASQVLPAEGYAIPCVEDGSEGSSSSEEKGDVAGEDEYEEQAKSAIYDYASEKSLSNEESKLYYQRSRDYRQRDSEPYLRLGRARTFSLNYEGRWAPRRYRRSGPFNDALPSRVSYHRIPEPHTATKQNAGRIVDQERSAADDGQAGGSRTDEGAKTATDEEPVTIDRSIHPELEEMSSMIQRVLDLRHKYIELSLQRPNDNPKDHPDWKVYPEPPKPVWTEDTTVPTSPSMTSSRANSSMLFGGEHDLSQSRSQASLASVAEEPVHPRPVSPPKKQRKPGQDIGSDFDLSHFEPMPGEDGTMTFELDQGSVYQVYELAIAMEKKKTLIKVPTLREYFMDLNIVKEVSEDGPIKSFAFRELQILDGKFNLHALENSYAEMMESKGVPHRDFYNVRKVDTHVHHSACMNSKHLLRFIKSKLKHSASDKVMFREGKEMTLQDVFDSLEMTAYDLSIDTLDTHAHTDSFHRFDKFNLKYNPVGSSRLREIFLKTDNYIQGRYLAELTREVISDLEASKYQMVEWRVSIYGRNIDEWDKLASWVIDNKLVSHNVRWLIQIPRLYSLYKKQKIVDNFEQLIINIFQPLYEVTQNPSSHPKLHAFLDRVIGFDSVDDESKVERRVHKKFPTPKNWDTPENPMYNYWIYYLWANMVPLNHWRKRRGLGTFVLRPHCGEAGDVEHLQSAVLCCHSISHGLLLRKASLLQYVFYLDQIGIAMSPLSNNALFLAYDRNPFQVYFRRGLNVSLSTDDPLQFAYTKEPLIEEYSVAAQICKLSGVDMCELAQHSVMQCGFEHELKQRWLGPDYHLPGIQGNNVAKTNVPNLREGFRHTTLQHEKEMIARYAAAYTASKASSASLHRDYQAASSSKGSKTTSRTSPVLPAPAAPLNMNRSSEELRSLNASNGPNTRNKGERPGNPNAFPDSPATGGHRQPSIFPGIVRQRTRRKSVRQSSGSENDYDALGGTGLGLSRSGTLEPDVCDPSAARPEEYDSY